MNTPALFTHFDVSLCATRYDQTSRSAVLIEVTQPIILAEAWLYAVDQCLVMYPMHDHWYAHEVVVVGREVLVQEPQESM